MIALIMNMYGIEGAEIPATKVNRASMKVVCFDIPYEIVLNVEAVLVTMSDLKNPFRPIERGFWVKNRDCETPCEVRGHHEETSLLHHGYSSTIEIGYDWERERMLLRGCYH